MWVVLSIVCATSTASVGSGVGADMTVENGLIHIYISSSSLTHSNINNIYCNIYIQLRLACRVRAP